MGINLYLNVLKSFFDNRFSLVAFDISILYNVINIDFNYIKVTCFA